MIFPVRQHFIDCWLSHVALGLILQTHWFCVSSNRQVTQMLGSGRSVVSVPAVSSCLSHYLLTSVSPSAWKLRDRRKFFTCLKSHRKKKKKTCNWRVCRCCDLLQLLHHVQKTQPSRFRLKGCEVTTILRKPPNTQMLCGIPCFG